MKTVNLARFFRLVILVVTLASIVGVVVANITI